MSVIETSTVCEPAVPGFVSVPLDAVPSTRKVIVDVPVEEEYDALHAFTRKALAAVSTATPTSLAPAPHDTSVTPEPCDTVVTVRAVPSLNAKSPAAHVPDAEAVKPAGKSYAIMSVVVDEPLNV